ncbi:MAG: 2-oxo acid dehydrogenase subunit E2 [Alphaproteobacteria bacterium]|nr:2-oxo acid dehydrogenase subunit E2 [Alphaproteobacteria bacterium]
MTAFRMPSLGADMDEGKLVEWLKQPGDAVKRGDVLAVVETQKGAIEIEVFSDGILEAIHAEPGTVLPVGAVMATIRVAGEVGATPTPPPAPSAVAAPPAAMTEKPHPAPSPEAAAVTDATRGLRVTPAARMTAARLGLPLSDLKPGPDGIIGLRDLPARTTASSGTPGATPSGLNLAEMRKAIGAAMARSKRDIPHYYVTSTIDMTPLTDWLASRNAGRAPPDRLLTAAPIIKACALALKRTPELNGHYENAAFAPGSTIRMGIGIALRGGGLIAPAIDQPDGLSLEEIMARLADLVGRVRGGRLRSSELMGATITLSSLGDNSADLVLPVIYPPQVAIIGAGQVTARPWVVDGAVVVRDLAQFSVAGDHRVNDGRLAARFLSTLDGILKQPEAL